MHPRSPLAYKLAGLGMLLVMAHWAYYYLGVIGILAWYGLKALWRALLSLGA